MSIGDRVREVLRELPAGVTLVAATKGRTPEEVLEAVGAGVTVVGENYLQEAESKHAAVGNRVRWHFIGHLQSNKARKAVGLFDLIETVSSSSLAAELSRLAAAAGRTLPVLVEINSGREPQKAGIHPEEAEKFVREIARLPGLDVQGLMTMGPLTETPEAARPYFRLTRQLFDGLGLKQLSMGMSDTWRIAVEEGATMIRVGTYIFGPRETRG